MSKENILNEISKEILSRDFLSIDDINSIVGTKLDLVLMEVAKNRLNHYEKRGRDLHKKLNKCSSSCEANKIQSQLQSNKIMKKQFNIIKSDMKSESNYNLLKDFIKENGHEDLLNRFYSTINGTVI